MCVRGLSAATPHRCVISGTAASDRNRPSAPARAGQILNTHLVLIIGIDGRDVFIVIPVGGSR